MIAKDLLSAFDPEDLNQSGPRTATATESWPPAAAGGHDLVQDFLGRPLSPDPFHQWLSGS